MPIFVFFVTAGVLFDGAFSLWVSSKESGKKPGATVSNKYQIQLKKSICCRKNPEAATVGVL